MEYLLSESAVQEYLLFVKDIASILENEKVSPSEIPDEEFREASDGRLECFVMIKSKRYSFFFEKGDWMVEN